MSDHSLSLKEGGDSAPPPNGSHPAKQPDETRVKKIVLSLVDQIVTAYKFLGQSAKEDSKRSFTLRDRISWLFGWVFSTHLRSLKLIQEVSISSINWKFLLFSQYSVK